MTDAFEHEHILHVGPSLALSDRQGDTLGNTRDTTLTREQLWNGVRYTVEVPQSLDASIDAAEVHRLATGELRRQIQRGSTHSVDEVSFSAERIEIRTVDPRPFAGSTLTISIEADEAAALRVRFHYVIRGLEPGRDVREDRARQRAYEQHDAQRLRAALQHIADARDASQ